MGLMLYGLILVLFLGTGFTVVPHGSIGYGRLFGKVYRRDLGPGLHYLAPRPFVRLDHWPVREVKSIMTNDAHEYVSGDLNLVSLSVNVQYRVGGEVRGGREKDPHGDVPQRAIARSRPGERRSAADSNSRET